MIRRSNREHYTDTPDKLNSRHRAHITELSHAAYVALSLATIIQSASTPELPHGVSELVWNTVNAKPFQCISTSETDTQNVSSLMQNGGQVESVILDLETSRSATEVDLHAEEHRVVREFASSLGLHVPDMSSDLAPLRGDVESPPSTNPNHETMPIEAFVSQANSALETHYGIAVTVLPSNTPEQSGQSIDLSSLSDRETRALKHNILLTLDTINQLPTEYIELIDLETITFDQLGLNDQNGVILGEARWKERSISLTSEQFISPNIVHHELFHLLDREMCGMEAHSDETFSALNPLPPEEFYTGGTFSDLHTQGDLISRQNFDFSDQSLPDSHDIVVERAYGLRSVAEDKATTGELVHDFYGISGTVLDPTYSNHTLSEKIHLLYSRIYALNPAIAEYLILKPEVMAIKTLTLREVRDA